VRILREDFAGAVHVRSQCCHSRGALSVHVWELHPILHQPHTEVVRIGRSRSRRRSAR
jgi:hypothetical protein